MGGFHFCEAQWRVNKSLSVGRVGFFHALGRVNPPVPVDFSICEFNSQSLEQLYLISINLC